MQEHPSIWTKVDYSLAVEPQVVKHESEAEAKQRRRAWRWLSPVLDIAGTLFWVYLFLMVFVTDIDRDLFGNVARYRFFLFLAIALWVAVAVRKTWAILFIFSYVLGFPLVVLLWKVPKVMLKSGNAVTFLAAFSAIVSVFSHFTRTVIVGATAAFSALAISLSHDRVVLGIAGVWLAALLVEAIYDTIKATVVPARFVRMQQRGIRKILNSPAMHKVLTPGEELRRPEIEKFSESQLAAFTQSLGLAVWANRGLAYWAYQLERYRRSPATIFFNFVAYLWLLIRVLIGLALMNLALYHANPDAYTFQGTPSFLVIVRYCIAGLYGGEIQDLHPASTLANGLSVAAFMVGVIVFGGFALSSFLSFRATRDESDINDLIQEIRDEGSRLTDKFQADYQISIEEAIERLEQLKYGLAGLLTALSLRIPHDYDFGAGQRHRGAAAHESAD